MLRLTLPWIWKHPLGRRHRLGAYGRYVWWQSRCRLTSEPNAMAWLNRSRSARCSMLDAGFTACRYNPKRRRLEP